MCNVKMNPSEVDAGAGKGLGAEGPLQNLGGGVRRPRRRDVASFYIPQRGVQWKQGVVVHIIL